MKGKLKTFRTNSQCKKILEYLQTGASLTCLESIQLGSSHNLKSRICNIKEAGHNIKVGYPKVNGTYIARYSLVLDNEND